jgi:hypothetical protein
MSVSTRPGLSKELGQSDSQVPVELDEVEIFRMRICIQDDILLDVSANLRAPNRAAAGRVRDRNAGL